MRIIAGIFGDSRRLTGVWRSFWTCGFRVELARGKLFRSMELWSSSKMNPDAKGTETREQLGWWMNQEDPSKMNPDAKGTETTK